MKDEYEDKLKYMTISELHKEWVNLKSEEEKTQDEITRLRCVLEYTKSSRELCERVIDETPGAFQ